MAWPRLRKRRAFLLLETLAAGVLLGVAMVLTMHLLTWTANERRSAERRGWGIQEAANAMERLTAMPYSSLSNDSARSAVRLSTSAMDILPDAKVQIDIEDESDGMKRIDLALSWKGYSGVREAPVRLTAWVARKEAQP